MKCKLVGKSTDDVFCKMQIASWPAAICCINVLQVLACSTASLWGSASGSVACTERSNTHYTKLDKCSPTFKANKVPR